MFKLPDGIPGKHSDNQEWADYAEFHSVAQSISFFNLVRPVSLISDEIDISGIDDDSDRLRQKADSIANEVRNRNRQLGDLYPYKLENKDYSIKFGNSGDLHEWIYLFLLLSTRVNMGKHRIINEIDGALLFEHLCAEVSKEYFGKYTDVDIIGTSNSDSTNFRAKLEEIFTKIGEGGELHDNSNYRVQDDKVDIIAWIRFADKNPSTFIAFGQCKTGTSWVDRLSELNARAFCNKWFTRQPVLTPIRMFFTAQYFPRDLWYVRASEAGLVFDRFRILEYLPEKLDENIVEKIKIWCEGVMEKYTSNQA